METTNKKQTNMVIEGDEAAASTSTPQEKAHEQGDLLRLIQESERKTEQDVREMRDLIKSMMTVLRNQPNTKKDLKHGIIKLNSMIECLEGTRKKYKKDRDELAERVWRRAPASFADVTGASRPVPRNKKRGPTSPLLPEKTREKRTKSDASQSDWTEAQSRKSKRRQEKKKTKIAQTEQQQKQAEEPSKGPTRRKKPKPNAILLKPAEGKTYADVLSLIRREVKPEEKGVEVMSVRQTRAGEVLLEIKETTADSRASFKTALLEAVGTDSSVKELIPKITLEIRDLDCCTTEEEIEEALKRGL